MATRLRFKELPEAFIPRSEAVWSHRVNATTTLGRDLVTSVARWRGVAMSNNPLKDP
jgi:hypothetical protein